MRMESNPSKGSGVMSSVMNEQLRKFLGINIAYGGDGDEAAAQDDASAVATEEGYAADDLTSDDTGSLPGDETEAQTDAEEANALAEEASPEEQSAALNAEDLALTDA